MKGRGQDILNGRAGEGYHALPTEGKNTERKNDASNPGPEATPRWGQGKFWSNLKIMGIGMKHVTIFNELNGQ